MQKVKVDRSVTCDAYLKRKIEDALCPPLSKNRQLTVVQKDICDSTSNQTSAVTLCDVEYL